MQKAFDVNQVIYLTHDNKIEEYTITGVCGYGASCIVYDAQKGAERKVRIKEYFPVIPACVRTEGNCVHPEEDKEGFELGLNRFRKSFEVQTKLRMDERLTNSIIPIEQYCIGYETAYIVTTDMTGESFDKRPVESLHELFKILMSVSKVIDVYHEKELLHLDIKPSNIFRIPETNEHIMLFDFDSVVESNELKNGHEVISYSAKWAAPEQMMGCRVEIGPWTDIYAIGAMAFTILFEREVTEADRGRFSKRDFGEARQDFFKNVDSILFEKIEDFFHKTLSVNVKRRYLSVKELLEALQELLMLSEPKRKYIVDNLPRTNRCFLGRETELCELHDLLKCNKVVCVRGIGGIGKTELVKNYALKYKDEFGHIIFATYLDNIQRMFLDESNWMIYNYQSTVAENILDAFNEKFNLFRDLVNQSSKDILIILDDLSDFQEDTLFQLLSLDCKFIITSRADASKYDIKTMELGTISEEEALITVFENYYGKVTNIERQTVNDIIEEVDKHTLVVELIAKQMKASRIKPEEMLKKVKNQGVINTYEEEVVVLKNNSVNKGSASEHVQNLFKLAELQRNEVICLKNLSLIPSTGIRIDTFRDWSGLNNFNIINELIENGWITYSKDRNVVSLHSVIASVISTELESDLYSVDLFLSNIIEWMNKDDENDKSAAEKQVCLIARRILRFDSITDQMAEFLRVFAFCLDSMGEIGERRQTLEKVLVYYLNKGENIVLVDIYKQLGQNYIFLDPMTALAYFDKAEAVCYRLGCFDDAFGILLGKTQALCMMQKPKKALKTIRKLLPHCQECTLWYVYVNMGDCYKGMGNITRAKKFYRTALALMKQRGDESFEREMQFSIIWKMYGDFKGYPFLPQEDMMIVKNVIEYYEDLLISEGEYSATELIEIYGGLFRAYLLNKDTWNCAEEYGIKVIAQYECIDDAMKNHENEAIFKYLLADKIYKIQERFEEAKELLIQAGESFGHDEHWIALRIYTALVLVCYQLKQANEATQYGIKCLDILEKVPGGSAGEKFLLKWLIKKGIVR